MTDPTRTEDVEERVFPPITRGLVDCFYDRTESYTGCYDCGRQYGGAYGFPDLIVPDEVWERISPTGDQGGLLCPSCIVKRCAQEGIRCEAEWKSGPFVPTHADARSEQLTGDQLTRRPDLDERPSGGEDGYIITARVREKGLRPAIVNGLYYWTDLDPHDDEAWVVDAIVKAAQRRLADDQPGEDGVGERQRTTDEVVNERIQEFLRGRVDHHRNMAEIVAGDPLRSDHQELADAYEGWLEYWHE